MRKMCHLNLAAGPKCCYLFCVGRVGMELGNCCRAHKPVVIPCPQCSSVLVHKHI